MIKNSFVFLDKISRQKEQGIWSQGIKDWDSFIFTKSVKGITQKSKGFYDRKLIEAEKELHRMNSSFFTNSLPRSEHWRLYDSFKEDAVFLDIETDGRGKYSDITVMGLFDGIETKTMVRGINFDINKLKQELEKYKILVTFNGSCFDIPFIKKRYFQYNVIPDIPHIDLRFCCSRIGLNHGLKQIERELGIKRKTQELVSCDAITLWNLYRQTGDSQYLKTLVEYNEEDVINLKKISSVVCERLKEKIMS